MSNNKPLSIEVGKYFIIPGMDRNFIPEKRRVRVVGIDWEILPLLNRLDEKVMVEFDNGERTTVSGFSLRLSQQNLENN